MISVLKFDMFSRLFIEHKKSCGKELGVSITLEDLERVVVELHCWDCDGRIRETFSADEAMELRELLKDEAGFLRFVQQTEKRD